jgi:hypothetical protein
LRRASHGIWAARSDGIFVGCALNNIFLKLFPVRKAVCRPRDVDCRHDHCRTNGEATVAPSASWDDTAFDVGVVEWRQQADEFGVFAVLYACVQKIAFFVHTHPDLGFKVRLAQMESRMRFQNRLEIIPVGRL